MYNDSEYKMWQTQQSFENKMLPETLKEMNIEFKNFEKTLFPQENIYSNSNDNNNDNNNDSNVKSQKLENSTSCKTDANYNQYFNVNGNNDENNDEDHILFNETIEVPEMHITDQYKFKHILDILKFKKQMGDKAPGEIVEKCNSSNYNCNCNNNIGFTH